MSLGGAFRAGRVKARAGAAAVAVGAAAAAALWASGSAPGWLAPAVSAVATAALAEEVVRRQRRMHRGQPVECHVALADVSYLRVPAGPGEPQHTAAASGHTVRLHVMAPERTVVLTGLRAVVLARRPPRGELIPHAGVLPVRAYTVLLDEDPPRLEPGGSDTPPAFSYRVSPDDPETFELRAETAQWHVTWVLELDWVCGRRSGTAGVDLGGHPFRTVARPPRGLSWE